MGSSRVSTCWLLFSLIRFSIAASVVLFPEPVTPVTSTSPRFAMEISSRTAGRLSSSSVGISNGITRMMIPIVPRCRKMFTRNRPTPGAPHEQS